jgi:hypothetical protein
VMSTAATTRWLTPPEIADRIGIDVGKVLTWIRRGELAAYDLSEKPGGRPRYRIDPLEFAAFLPRRQVKPPTPRQRRCKSERPDTPQYV